MVKGFLYVVLTPCVALRFVECPTQGNLTGEIAFSRTSMMSGELS